MKPGVLPPDAGGAANATGAGAGGGGQPQCVGFGAGPPLPGAPGRCVLGHAFYHDAFDPLVSVRADGGDRGTTYYEVSPAARAELAARGGLLWAEPNWQSIGLRVYWVDTAAHEWLAFVGGLALTAAAFVGAKKWRVRFGKRWKLD